MDAYTKVVLTVIAIASMWSCSADERALQQMRTMNELLIQIRYGV